MMKNEKQTPLSPPLSGGKHAPSPEVGQAGNPRSGCSHKGRDGEGLGFIPYNKKLTALARENRKNPTAAEIKMWNEVLRMRHFSNYKFSRQKPIADFIVDFYCAELRLAIEIDGDSHAEAEDYDAARTAALDTRGISVIRYTNDEILNNLEGVYDDLVRRVEQISAGVAAQ